MTVYVFLYLLMILGSVFIYKISKAKNKARNVAIFCSIAVISVIAFRHPSMGIDLHYGKNQGYLFSYGEISEFSWTRIFNQSYLNFERGYVVFNKILSYFFTNVQFLLIACALISLIPICVFLYKNSRFMVMSIIVYMSLPTFVFVYSGLRQAIAIGICYIAISFAYKKKLVLFLLTVVLAISFHKTSILFLVAFPLMNIKFKQIYRWMSLGVLAVVFIFRTQIYMFAISLFGKTTKPDNNGSYMFFLALVVIYILCFIYSDYTRKNEGFLNLLFVACLIQAMGGVQNTVVRAAYYFIPVVAVLIPNVIMRVKNSFERAVIGAGAIAAFSTYGFYVIYSTSWSMSYPYHFFWEVI